ncbi:hypothetical protein, conserved [Trypanosoma vivax Y486]|uniref:Uncharacterized protein n=1 Tax=Trypanosoma vivax (strain Y486) TaxID=1055687 RepID=F9WMS0_TRYVY|nr:hypothetical protein, conserved [Trypanosoma vivax Y486]|eukprot:CCD18832.1 hypothetical protein, conserved [Trypanosoma vivax Y486]
MTSIQQANFRLGSGSELVVVVPFEMERCIASLKVISTGGNSEPRVDILGAPAIVDVPYNLVPGAVFTVFAWSNATIHIEGPKQLIMNCFRSTTPPSSRHIVEYHCIIHNARIIADKQNNFGPMILICGRNGTENHAVARTLCSYAARTGWAPQLVDLDCGGCQMLGAPSTVCSAVIEYPITIDEELTTGPLSIGFFVGSTECQTKSGPCEWSMLAPYTHYCGQLLSCVSERVARHRGNVSGSSGAVIVLPELKGTSGLLFIEDLLRRFNISHVLCIGDDFLFCGIQSRIPKLRDAISSRSAVLPRIDRISSCPHFPSTNTRPDHISSIIEKYFFGSGFTDLQPSEVNKRYSSIEIFLLKDLDGQTVLTSVLQDSLEGIVGCVGALFEYSKIREKDKLSVTHFALARIQSFDANGVNLLISTHSSLPEKLVLIIGTFRWVTS